MRLNQTGPNSGQEARSTHVPTASNYTGNLYLQLVAIHLLVITSVCIAFWHMFLPITCRCSSDAVLMQYRIKAPIICLSLPSQPWCFGYHFPWDCWWQFFLPTVNVRVILTIANSQLAENGNGMTEQPFFSVDIQLIAKALREIMNSDICISTFKLFSFT